MFRILTRLPHENLNRQHLSTSSTVTWKTLANAIKTQAINHGGQGMCSLFPFFTSALPLALSPPHHPPPPPLFSLPRARFPPLPISYSSPSLLLLFSFGLLSPPPPLCFFLPRLYYCVVLRVRKTKKRVSKRGSVKWPHILSVTLLSDVSSRLFDTIFGLPLPLFVPQVEGINAISR